MAVVAMWQCDRVNSMFANKKDAENHDKMLELAENFGAFLLKEADGISETDAENIGLLLAKNKDLLLAACKGKPEALLEISSDEPEEETSNITPLSVNA